MKLTHSVFAGAALAAAFFFHASSFCLAAPGSLTPPGPPAPTMTTLDDIDAKLEKRTPISSLPFIISVAGSYYVTANLTGVSGQQGITVSADDVTIDLNGFTLTGVAGSFHGVNAGGNRKNLTVRNGVIRGWGSNGITVAGAANATTAVRDIHSVGNGAIGINVGRGTIMADCIAEGNATVGINCLEGVIVSDCIAVNNGTAGFALGTQSVATGCIARINGTDGFTGSRCVVEACEARVNTEDGFDLSSSRIDNCVAHNNTVNGIDNSFGTTTGCVSSNNGGDGIIMSSNSGIVTGCFSQFNNGDGIRVTNDCVVRDNNCDENGFQAADGAGIHATGARNRIEGNNVNDNDRGIDVDGGNNFIVKNTAVMNTVQYDIVANNKVGTIVAAPNSVAIAGATGGAGVGSTDPWANFSY